MSTQTCLKHALLLMVMTAALCMAACTKTVIDPYDAPPGSSPEDVPSEQPNGYSLVVPGHAAPVLKTTASRYLPADMG